LRASLLASLSRCTQVSAVPHQDSALAGLLAGRAWRRTLD
jgi:hypothetical protein